MIGVTRHPMTGAQEAANARSLLFVAADEAERAGDCRIAAERYARLAAAEQAAGRPLNANEYAAHAAKLREAMA